MTYAIERDEKKKHPSIRRVFLLYEERVLERVLAVSRDGNTADDGDADRSQCDDGNLVHVIPP